MQIVIRILIVYYYSLEILVTYDWVLKFHISNKSNKQVMLGVTSESVNCFKIGGIKLKKGNAM